MIDEYGHDGLGWARFCKDRQMRYRLGRKLSTRSIATPWPAARDLERVTFLMVNPSDADAFRNDPTIVRCIAFARRWGADVLEVANLFALRSSDPRELDLYPYAHGGDTANDEQIVEACVGARLVIAAWGDNGMKYGRALDVCRLLYRKGVHLHDLGFTQGGNPKHPLARGKSWIPYERTPRLWSVDWDRAIR